MDVTSFDILESADMSTDVFSPAIGVKSYKFVSIHAAWIGTPVGTLILQVSNSPDKIGWSNITPSRLAVNGPGDVMFNLDNIGYAWIRVFFHRVSGTGSITAIGSNKR